MNSPVIPISNLQLTFSVLLVLIAGGVAAFFRLGLLRSLAWGTVRTFVQLFLVGYVLAYIFALDNPWLIVSVVTVLGDAIKYKQVVVMQ